MFLRARLLQVSSRVPLQLRLRCVVILECFQHQTPGRYHIFSNLHGDRSVNITYPTCVYQRWRNLLMKFRMHFRLADMRRTSELYDSNKLVLSRVCGISICKFSGHDLIDVHNITSTNICCTKTSIMLRWTNAQENIPNIYLIHHIYFHANITQVTGKRGSI
jgi:hypothetical protein